MERVVCPTCKKEIEKDNYQKHQWKWHPKNKMEEAWSKTNFKHFKGSTYYESFGPYY